MIDTVMLRMLPVDDPRTPGDPGNQPYRFERLRDRNDVPAAWWGSHAARRAERRRRAGLGPVALVSGNFSAGRAHDARQADY
jgi:hypothetical protein